MSSFVAANPDISSGTAQKFEIVDAKIRNLLITGNLTSTANIGDILDLVVSNITATNLVSENGNIILLTSASGNIGNVLLLGGNIFTSGQIATLGNVFGGYFIGNGSQLTGVTSTAVLPSVVPADIRGNVIGAYANVAVVSTEGISVAGNVLADYFIGNGSHLTGIAANVTLPSVVPADIRGNVIGTYANVAVVSTGGISVAGNVLADYFIGNGSQLMGIYANVNVNVTTDKYLSANVSQSNIYLSANSVNSPGMLLSLNSDGKVAQPALDGYLVVPEGYVANASTRLGLGGGGLPVGSLVRQTDDGNSYMLTMSPSNIDSNWITFDGVIFPVNTVFGRNGDVLASYGDYLDSYVELTDAVGVVPAGNAVSEALQMLQNTKQDNIIRQSTWVTSNNQSILNATPVPLSFGSFHTTNASNVTITALPSGNIQYAHFTNTGVDNLFIISTRVTFTNMSNNGHSAITMALNGNLSTVNRVAESYESSSTHQQTQIHSLSTTVFIPANEYVEIIATVDSTRVVYIDGLISIANVK